MNATAPLLLLAVGMMCVLISPLMADDTPAPAPDEADEPKPPAALAFTMKSLDGRDVDLARYHGRAVLMVNVASKCGYTKQYKDLQALHEKYAERGLAILGFPCNQFGKQEPGSAEEIAAFCEKNYGVAFDLFYQYLTGDDTGLEDTGPVKWNFEKFLIDRDGKVIARYRSKVNPRDDKVIDAIEAALGPVDVN
ncbi:MAG: redoxin domain-containing protein [Planctomycetes bacterium]|jgi:glutathione peroxidase|nr:redoxin domain-containing protein [Planctomycetota bacterium]